MRFGTYTITLGLLVGVGPRVSSIHAQQRAVRASNGGSDGTYEVKVQGTKADIDLPLVPARPKAVRFNDLDGVLAEVKAVRF